MHKKTITNSVLHHQNKSHIKSLKKILLLSFSATILSTSNALAAPDCIHNVSKLKCLEYVKSYDGDTMVFNIPHLHHIFGNKIKVSLDNIKTPSIRSKNKCAKNIAKQAKNFTKEILKKAKYVEVDNVARDRSFGIKGDIIIDNKKLSDLLLKKNFAVPKKEFKKTNWCKIEQKIGKKL